MARANIIMKHHLMRNALIPALLLSASLLAAAQNGPSLAIRERDVRAQMTFLAGDAMQGRGSGTIFERIAAEYIGSSCG